MRSLLRFPFLATCFIFKSRSRERRVSCVDFVGDAGTSSVQGTQGLTPLLTIPTRVSFCVCLGYHQETERLHLMSVFSRNIPQDKYEDIYHFRSFASWCVSLPVLWCRRRVSWRFLLRHILLGADVHVWVSPDARAADRTGGSGCRLRGNESTYIHTSTSTSHAKLSRKQFIGAVFSTTSCHTPTQALVRVNTNSKSAWMKVAAVHLNAVACEPAT